MVGHAGTQPRSRRRKLARRGHADVSGTPQIGRASCRERGKIGEVAGRRTDRHGQWLRAGFFFFQAEDGIRDTSVTGVQTCALPILKKLPKAGDQFVVIEKKSDSRAVFFEWLDTLGRSLDLEDESWLVEATRMYLERRRSEERRVGKEGRSARSQDGEQIDTDSGCVRDFFFFKQKTAYEIHR